MISLAEVLSLEVMQRARPELVVGEHLLDREVRWVHTSELAEAAALLKGGELLLTTGLGLAGRGPVAQQAYVSQLADRRVAALALELGWTFSAVPDALAEAARRHDLPLVALHEIVPFVEMTEAVQSRLLRENYAELRLGRDVDQILQAQLLRGEGLQALVAVLADFLRCPVVLETAARHVVSCAGLPEGLSPRAALKRSRMDSAPIEVLGESWGFLHLLELPADRLAMLTAVKERAPSAIALSLLRDQQSTSLGSRLARTFVRALLSGQLGSRGDAVAQATLASFAVPVDATFVGFAVGNYPADESALALRATQQAVREHRALAADLDGVVLGLMEAVHVRDPQTLGEHMAAVITTTMGRSGSRSRPRVAIGPPVSGLLTAGHTIREAQATLLLAEELGLTLAAVTAQGLAADRVLSRVIDDPAVESIIAGEIGSLLAYDAAHDSCLTETLWTYLTHASGKSDAALALHVRRQTLYKRLAKIEELIGSVEAPQRRLSLLMALRIHQLLARRGRVPRSATATADAAAIPYLRG